MKKILVAMLLVAAMLVLFVACTETLTTTAEATTTTEGAAVETPDSFIISTLLSDYGSIAASKLQGIKSGELVTVTTAANAGYQLVEIRANGVVVSTSPTVVLTVTENLSIEAIWAPKDSAD